MNPDPFGVPGDLGPGLRDSSGYPSPGNEIHWW